MRSRKIGWKWIRAYGDLVFGRSRRDDVIKEAQMVVGEARKMDKIIYQ